MSQRHAITPATEAVFLEKLEGGYSVTYASKAAGFDRSSFYDRRKADPEFAKRWDDSFATGTAMLEDEARRRAFEGVERGKYYQGEKFASEREYSDSLLFQLLKARAPNTYRERIDVNATINFESIVERLLQGRQRALASSTNPIDPTDPVLQ